MSADVEVKLPIKNDLKLKIERLTINSMVYKSDKNGGLVEFWVFLRFKQTKRSFNRFKSIRNYSLNCVVLVEVT